MAIFTVREDLCPSHLSVQDMYSFSMSEKTGVCSPVQQVLAPSLCAGFWDGCSCRQGDRGCQPLPASPCSTVSFSIILLPTLLEFPVFVIV